MKCYKCDKEAIWRVIRTKGYGGGLGDDRYCACNDHKNDVKNDRHNSFYDNGIERIGETTMETVKLNLTKDEVTNLLKGMKASKLKTKLKESLVTDKDAFMNVLKTLEEQDIFYVITEDDITNSRKSHKRLFELVEDFKGLFSSSVNVDKLSYVSDKSTYSAVTVSGIKGTNEDHERIGRIIEQSFKDAGFKTEWCGGYDQRMKIWDKRD